MNTSESTSQWDRLLCNLGAWEGSFTHLSPEGLMLDDTPTRVTLTGLNNNQTIQQTIQHFSTTGEIIQNKVLEYSSLSRSVLFFEDGAFSQGSTQLALFGDFGAELGFIAVDRRLRIVELFKDCHFASITLIREHRQHTPSPVSLPLSVEMLQGNWQGEAVTLYPDWRNPDRYRTTLSIQVQDNQLHQRLTAPGLELASTATIDGHILRFDQGSYPSQILLLPGGASCHVPKEIPRGKPFLLEAGWLVEPTLRQRMMRRYDARGGWESLTLVTERKIS